MVCKYKLFMGDRVWMTQTGERAPFWCTALTITRNDRQYLISPVVVHQNIHYTQYLHYNIPSDLVVHNSSSGCMDCDGWHKSMKFYPSMCFYSTLNPQVLFYDGYVSHFYDREFNIPCRQNTQYFIRKTCDYVHEQTNNNGLNMNLKNLYGNARMN